MTLSRNNNKAIVGGMQSIESLCSTCIYSGCTECPDRKNLNFNGNKYPHVKDFQIKGVRVVVTDCESYTKRMPKTKKIRKAKFVWDSKTRSFVKAN